MTPQLPVGSVVAGYRILSLLGEGSTGAVYLAERDGEPGRVALKLLGREFARDERFRKRFMRESDIAESGVGSATVAHNKLSGGGDGIALLESDGNTVTRNQVTKVGGVGIYLDAFGPDPTTTTGSDDNTIANNQINGSGLAGIAIFGGSDGNRLTSNVANASHGDGSNGDPDGGIYIEASTSNVLDGNTATKNTADGVHILSAGNTVKATTALDNLRRGIDAVDGTIDGGDNHGSGNGLEPQCTGVACS